MPDMSKAKNQPAKGPRVDPETIPPIRTVEQTKSFGVADPNKTKSKNHWTVRGRVISAAFAWPTAVFCAAAMLRWTLGVFIPDETLAPMTEVDSGTFQTILLGMGVILGPIFATVGFGIRNKK